MLSFHDTLEKFFRKNFSEEIHRLTFDGPEDQHPANTGTRSRKPSAASPYMPQQNRNLAQDAISIAPSTSAMSMSTSRGQYGIGIPPLPSRASVVSSPSSVGTVDATRFSAAPPSQTPLQKHLAHIARHGINGVSSGSGEAVGSDTMSVSESPSGSIVNVAGWSNPAAGSSGSSIVGSISGSIKGRFSRLGSLSFGRPP
jgi:dedicator of cytokinesis protein 3